MNFKLAILAAAMFLYCSTAFGGDLAVSSDQVTFSTTSGYSSAETIGANGIVTDATGIPVGAITSDLSLAFTMQSTNTADGAYTFEIGMFIDHDDTQRRLEIFIPNVTMTFSNSGATLAGSITGSGIQVHGRSADGNTTVSTNTTNSAFSFNGNSLSISAGNQVTDIQSAGGILGDLVATFNTQNQGHYNYGVFLAQTGGPEALTFKTAGGTALPCAPATPFAINTSKNSTFSGSSALQGEIAITGATDANSVAPAVYSGTCSPTVTSSGGGGGTTTTTTTDDTTTTVTSCPTGQVLIDGACFSSTASPAETITSVSGAVTVTESFVVSETTTVEEIEGLTTAVTDSVNSVLQSIPPVTDTNTPIVVDKAAVNNAIRAVKALLAVNTEAARQGKAVQNTAVVTALRQQRDLVRTLSRSSEPLTVDEKADVVTNLKDTLRALSSLNRFASGSTTSITQLTRRARATNAADGTTAIALTGGSADLLATLDAIDEVGEIVSAAIQAEIDIDSEFVADMQELVDSSVATVFDDVGAVVDPTDSALQAEYEDAASTRALLMAEPQLLESLLEVVGISLSSESGVDTVSLNSSLRNAGLRTAPAQALAANVAGVATNPGGITLQLFNGDLTAQQSIENALGSGVSGSYSTANGTLELTTNGDGFPVYVQSVNIVSESFPEGVFNLPDGRLVTISDGIASVHAPALVDIVAFAGALADARATMTINDDGALVIDGSGFTFIGSPGFHVTAVSGASGDVTVQAPSAAPTGDGYAYTLDFGGGVTQTILPHLQQSEFYDVLSSQGFAVTTDRSTGAISVTTPDGAEFRFKPDFFLATPNQEDLNFRLANGGLLAPAFRPVDANGDGVTDYRVMIGAIVQVLYGLP